MTTSTRLQQGLLRTNQLIPTRNIDVSNIREWRTRVGNATRTTTFSTPRLSGSIQTFSSTSRADHSHCVDLVRDRDREGYLCGLLMPSSVQKAYFALRAFNVELATIKDGSYLRGGNSSGRDDITTQSALESPSMVGFQMRIHWWKEALEAVLRGRENDTSNNADNPNRFTLYNSCWRNPVVRALANAHQQVGFTRRFLERMLDAREADLEFNQYSTMNEATAYAEETVSSLLYLTLESVGVRNEEADIAASHAGVGIGLVIALRATPLRLLYGEMPLPSELFYPDFPYQNLSQWNRHGNATSQQSTVSLQSLLNESDGAILHEAIRRVAQEASSRIVQAQQVQNRIPRPGRPCFLPVVPALHYLSSLEQSNFNLLEPSLTNPTRQLSLLMLMTRTWLTGIF